MAPSEDPPGHYPVQKQDPPGLESKMDPPPDYGYDKYKGTGKLKGKIALVTGADSGIGRAIAYHFACEGANVAIAYWNEHPDAEDTKKACEKEGAETLLLPGDVSKYEICKELVDKTVQKWGRIDVLCNNAAFQGPAKESFVDIERERLEFTFKTNIMAYFSITQLALKHMSEGSAIVNTCSIQAAMPMPGILDYASTKGAIVTFTKGVASELAAKKIRCNVIAPGPVWTPLIPASFPPEIIKDFGSNMAPMKRAAMPREYGPPAIFLADNTQSSYITGIVLPVTGGMLM